MKPDLRFNNLAATVSDFVTFFFLSLCVFTKEPKSSIIFNTWVSAKFLRREFSTRKSWEPLIKVTWMNMGGYY